MSKEIKLRVRVEYTVTITEGGLRNYDDPSPRAVAEVEKQNIAGDPAVVGADLFDLPYEVTVTPMEITS